MSFSNTEPLRRELTAALPRRPFAIEFWDGTAVPATEPDAPTFTFHSPQALAHVIRAPGELGLGRAYVLGLVDADSIEKALAVVDTFEPPRLSVAQMARLGVALVRACGVVAPPRRPASELRLTGERHTIGRDRRAVRYHYDSGNEFFALFLDPSMTYSCGYFRGGADTLADAQRAKLDLVCTKLRLTEGERVLDVGCGWGSFAIHAASTYGVRVLGVTLSEEQAKLGRERVRDAGLADLVELRVADYRELAGERFDAISSIGMVEHVGEERIDLYMRTLWGLLRPGGRLLNHGIAKLADFDTSDEGPFSERFVFPDGVPLPLSRIALAMERTGLVVRHVEGFPEDYSRTLGYWIESYENRWEDAVRLAGEERARIYRLYLRAARAGFDTGWASVYQVLAHKSPVEEAHLWPSERELRWSLAGNGNGRGEGAEVVASESA
ncbi:MAG TPA: cyclopropane-fatty-acyl-phospholipid synthase family protein [Solirubrobacteraceae bacterium]|nr:cyclopropane-fatty-acyl-phospholipid synthase family protein [Solirubrobacteraceae bacterium]